MLFQYNPVVLDFSACFPFECFLKFHVVEYTSLSGKLLATGAAKEFPVRYHNMFVRKLFRSLGWAHRLQVTSASPT